MNGKMKVATKINIGQLIAAKLKESGRSVVWFAQQLGYSRTTVYKIFAKKAINTDTLMKISQTLGFDFFKVYSDSLKCGNNKNS